MALTDVFDSLLSRVGLPHTLPENPFPLLETWLNEATAAKHSPNPNAMVLATASPGGEPSARVVLCKSLEVEPGCVVFFTNYTSLKGRNIEANARAAGVFYWDAMGRQSRVSGRVTRISEHESAEYFRSRSLLSRLGAWASEQGQPLEQRTDLIIRVRDAMKRFGVGPHHLLLSQGAPEVPRPPHWGGYRICAERVELWLGGDGRLHDRAAWERSVDEATCRPTSRWTATRLQP